KRQKQPLFEIIRAKINYHPITQSILWKRAVNSGNAAFQRYGETKIIKVFYEQFVTEPKEHLQNVCEFIGTEYDEMMLETSVSMSSNISYAKKTVGFDSSLIDKWKTMLSSSEIFLVEIICGKDAAELGYQMSGKKPNYLWLLIYIAIFPFHVVLAYLLSASRFKNPFKTLKQMIFK
ncbi:MAG: sulfotransferase, partial [Proteobacteria bacterium]|nr:sulfotransferase [Pseudomonadota bacterium]